MIVVYIVIPKFLKMSIGKVGVTCGHATQLLMQEHAHRLQRREGSDVDDCEVFNTWLDSSYPKIVLGASDEEFAEVRRLSNKIVVVDVGLKEVAAGSETAIGLWPILKSEAPLVIQKLHSLR